jgi:hypothetical protein
MFEFLRSKPYLTGYYEKLSIAYEHAIAKKWARVNRPKLLDKNRPTVGEMMPPPEKPTTDV